MSAPEQHTPSLKERNRRLLKKLLFGVLCMFGFCYFLVPIYSLVCKQAGINGRFDLVATQASSANDVDTSRTVTVEFLATTNSALNFQFKPLARHIQIHPGENKMVYFFAENDTGHQITVQAVPSIAPGIAAKYLKKTECFCFTQQTFLKGEKVDMPVLFHLDPDLPKDVKTVTLSYTMFDATRYIKKDQKHFINHHIHLNGQPADWAGGHIA